MRHVTVTLSEEQCREVRRIGQARQRAKTTDHKRSTRSGEELHIAGYAAEYALALALGTHPNREVGPRGSEGVSLRAHGATFNTKWVSKSWYDLRYFPHDLPPVEFMVLADQSLPKVRLVGWVTRAQFEDRYITKTLPRMGPRWLVERDKLNPMPEIYKALSQPVPRPIAAAMEEKEKKRQEVAQKREEEEETPDAALPGLFEEEAHNDPS